MFAKLCSRNLLLIGVSFTLFVKVKLTLEYLDPPTPPHHRVVMDRDPRVQSTEHGAPLSSIGDARNYDLASAANSTEMKEEGDNAFERAAPVPLHTTSATDSARIDGTSDAVGPAGSIQVSLGTTGQKQGQKQQGQRGEGVGQGGDDDDTMLGAGGEGEAGELPVLGAAKSIDDGGQRASGGAWVDDNWANESKRDGLVNQLTRPCRGQGRRLIRGDANEEEDRTGGHAGDRTGGSLGGVGELRVQGGGGGHAGSDILDSLSIQFQEGGAGASISMNLDEVIDGATLLQSKVCTSPIAVPPVLNIFPLVGATIRFELANTRLLRARFALLRGSGGSHGHQRIILTTD